MRMLFHWVRDLGRVFALAPSDEPSRTLGLGRGTGPKGQA